MPAPSPAPKRTAGLNPNLVLRFLLELFAVFTLGYWGYLAWPFPWPGALFMIGTPLFAIIVWGLFRSPRARVPLDPVGRGIVEIAVMGSAVIAWAMLGEPLVALVFGVVALASGTINLRREMARERRQDSR
ncbi:MAG: YrdB family protein [Salinibacterium sp.]|nr:YrdB family protein [Micrococcales bacterium]MCB1280380.1 YrdB family protein [Salinibacterium sp.]HNP16025.1 YrdB family protein [Terrimesophilobacter sp.]